MSCKAKVERNLSLLTSALVKAKKLDGSHLRHHHISLNMKKNSAMDGIALVSNCWICE